MYLWNVAEYKSGRVETKQGEMTFSHYASHCWNHLPMEIRSAPSVTQLKLANFSTAFNESVDCVRLLSKCFIALGFIYWLKLLIVFTFTCFILALLFILYFLLPKF